MVRRLEIVILILAVATAITTFLLTGAALRWAVSRGWLDVPNHRSSHANPTPRGGGIAIVIATVAGLLVSLWLGWISSREAIAFAGGGLLVATVGWADDRASVSPWTRVAIHFVAAGWALYWIGGLQSIVFQGFTVGSPLVANVLAAVGIVWTTNLYNFMDGIDGIAAIEGVTVGGLAAVVFTLEGKGDLAVVSTLLAAASCGFLAWNWSPARIFMGDVGSGFLGFLFGCLAVASERASPDSLPWILALAGVFVLDATVTLTRRALHREPIHAAHRSHAYQRITRAGVSHVKVSSVVAAINVVLGIFVILAFRYPELKTPLMTACVALLALVYLAVERKNPMYSKRPE